MLTPCRLGRTQTDAASVWVWTWVTSGGHLFALAAMTDPAAPRGQRPGGRDRLLYIDLGWPHLATATCDHYSELKYSLNRYADHEGVEFTKASLTPARYYQHNHPSQLTGRV
jgi:hypothetical protein